MNPTDVQDETTDIRSSHSGSREATPEKDISGSLTTGFLWLFFLFTAATFTSQWIIFQSIDNFLGDVRNMEDLCDRHKNSYDDAQCECVFDYLEGLDHPQFQYHFRRLQLPQMEHPRLDSSNPESLYINPKAYVLGCGNIFPERQLANKDVCEKLEKLMTTDLFTKWWFDADASCFNSIINTIKRVHPAVVLALALILTAVVWTPYRILQAFRTI